MELLQHFGWTQQIISAHMDELLKLPYCSDDKVTQLRAVYDKVSVNARWLEAIGVMADQYGSFLIPVIMGKLPADVWLQIGWVTTWAVWDVEEILQVVYSCLPALKLNM